MAATVGAAARDRRGGPMIAPLACASHLLIDLPLFGGPVVMVLGAMLLMARAERRRARDRPALPGG